MATLGERKLIQDLPLEAAKELFAADRLRVTSENDVLVGTYCTSASVPCAVHLFVVECT
jgi:hypothetical protein